MKHYRQQMYDAADEAAKKANGLMMLDPFRPVYLIHKPSTVDGIGAIDIVRDTLDVLPDGFELTTPKRLSPALTRVQTMYAIYETMRQLPILPLD